MTSKGDYYKYKTKKWFEKKGYFSDYLEKRQRIYIQGKVMFIKRDIVGSDGLAMNGEHLVFWQCKLNKANIDKGIKEFKKYPFPSNVERWVIVWTPRAREPEIVIVE